MGREMPSVMSAGSNTWHNCSFPEQSTECQLKHGWRLHNKRQAMLCIFGAMDTRVWPLVPLGVALPRPGCCIIMIRVILLGKHIKQIITPDCRPCLGRSKPGLKMCWVCNSLAQDTRGWERNMWGFLCLRTPCRHSLRLRLIPGSI